MHGFLAILLYLAAVTAAVLSARSGVRRPALREPALYLAAAAVVAHGLWLGTVLAPQAGLAVGIDESASLLGLVLAFGATLALLWPSYRGVAAIVLGLAALLAAGTGSLAVGREISAPGWPVAAHVALALGAAGMFGFAAVLALLLAVQDGQLRRRHPADWLSMLPPLESLERVLFAVIATGFAALSVAILAGFLFVTDLFAQHLVHKTTLALAAWAIFAVLLVGRWRSGWRGRQATRYTIAGFALLALAYFGSKFVLEIVLGRQWG